MRMPVPPLSQAIVPWLLRKLTAAAFATVIVVVYLSFSLSVHHSSGTAWHDWLTERLGMGSFLFLFVTPFNYMYGVTASMLVELLLFKLLHAGWLHAPLSLLFHAFCGFWALPMLFGAMRTGSLEIGWMGAACAAVFFFVDFALAKLRVNLHGSHAVQAFIFLPLTLFFISFIGMNL